MARKPRNRRKDKKSTPVGRAYIHSTFNNTLITLTDPQGSVILWGSAGTIGYKGSRKSTAFAAQKAGEDVGKKALEHGLKQVDVYVRGPGAGRESAIRALQGVGLFVTSIRDVTPIPHNGCRPRKRRRV
ncbi:MAG: 30S ribosomal protein S11 [Chloroflexi bacterium]|mgnify:FL=1|nr:30S ribosomal protein S11 [Chloroflexota bacterium]|tara:strand:+ start:273 stop:659 length:387 start_codon:yes stop_codon:yes gene_type:complete